MYLLQVDIANLRAIRDLSVDFRDMRHDATSSLARRWTVFLGENGCGKSSILKAIGLLLAGSEALPDLIDSPDQWIRNGAEEARIAARICTAEGVERNVALTLRRGEGRDSVIKRNSKSLKELDAALRHADRNYFIAGYGAFRRPPDGQQASRLHHRKFGRAAHLQTLFSATTELIGLEQWAMQLDYSEGPAGRQVVANALDQLLPGMRFKDINKRSGEVIMETVDGDVPLRQLSEGYQAMAAWAGDLLFRMSETFKDRESPLDARGVLLIDEMDLHLHPVWKRRLVDFINNAFPRMQVISTTHSPLAVQQCNEGELYVIRREEGGPSLIPFAGDPSKMRLSELFLSPLVGLDTLDSPKVAELRAEAQSIELKSGAPSPAELEKLQSIDAQLSGTTPLTVAEAPGFEQLIEASRKFRAPGALGRIAEAEFLFSTSKAVASTRRVSKKRDKPAAKKAPSRAKAAKPTSSPVKSTTKKKTAKAKPSAGTGAKKRTVGTRQASGAAARKRK